MAESHPFLRANLVLLLVPLAVLSTVTVRPATAQVEADRAAQDPADSTVVHEVELTDGNKLIGYILEISGGHVTFRTLDDLELTFRLSEVRHIRVPEGTRHGRQFWPRDPTDSRLFIGPTARVPGDRRGYVGLYELFFPSAAIGLGDVAMVSGGMSIFPGVGLNEQIYYVAPKIRFVGTDRVGIAGGALWLTLGFEDESAGMVYGVATVGSEQASITVGPAFPFVTDGGFTDEVLGLVGLEARLSPKVKVISENWILLDEGAFFTFGFRVLEGPATIEAALLVPSEGEAVLPIGNFSYSWR